MRGASAGSRRSRRRDWWADLDDERLLDLRFCDLGLTLDRSPLGPYVDRLYDELTRRGVVFRPHCWLGEEWFSPDGVPGFALPFFLAHPRLRRLERSVTHELEGGNRNWLMRLIRHEAGHAFDNAYRLRRRRQWREVFGPGSLPYPDSYHPRPSSRGYVQHLGSWYAQSHPTEDFAETFAVWLQPGSRWRTQYAGWPVIAKLEYVDALMREIGPEAPPVRTRAHVESLSSVTRSLREYYVTVLKRYAPARNLEEDELLGRVFTREPGRSALHAATFLRRLQPKLLAHAAEEVGCTRYLVHQVLRATMRRCADLNLYVPANRREAERRSLWLLRSLSRIFESSAGLRITL
jgi:hypothetical protein